MNSQYENLFDLKGKVALVAGGGGAIGAEMARALAAFGARIAVTCLKCESAPPVVGADGSEALQTRMPVFTVDVRDKESIDAAVQAVESQLGPLDILINAVGAHIEQPAQELTEQAWETVMEVNLRGAFWLSQAVARSMIARGAGGSHIHVTSVRSDLGIRRGYAAYCASKGGLRVLIKQLAVEWAPYGIRVNGIAPTFTRTPLVAGYLNDPVFYNGLVNRIPMGRVCETTDLAGIAVFLASGASAFITGQNIYVDGGVTASQ